MIYNENNVTLNIDQDYATPKRADVYLNPQMSFNRELVLDVLITLVNESENSIDCLDAFSATGLCAIQWKKNIGHKVNITAIDLKDDCIEKIKLNCKLNKIEAITKTIVDINDISEKSNTINVCKASANVVMHLKAFDFM